MHKKYTLLVVLNTLSFLLVLFVNYIVQTHTLTDISMAEVSHKYDTLFTPADYAFFIWLIIYIMCAAFIIYQWKILKNDSNNYIKRTGIWFSMVNIFNALWCYCWVHEWLGLCVVIMLCLLFSLIILTVRLRLELDDEPVKTIMFVWWPLVYYLGMDSKRNCCLHCIVAGVYWLDNRKYDSRYMDNYYDINCLFDLYFFSDDTQYAGSCKHWYLGVYSYCHKTMERLQEHCCHCNYYVCYFIISYRLAWL